MTIIKIQKHRKQLFYNKKTIKTSVTNKLPIKFIYFRLFSINF
jgi:hypothetical protein